MPPMKTDAIKAFLTQFAPSDLAALYSYNQEVQVIVARGNGERVQGDYKGRKFLAYTDGDQTWKPIRIPINANSEPSYEDSPMAYDLLAHAEGIGMTGWDWVNKISRWVAFDFDAITGHSEKHSKKLTDDELENIRKCLEGIDTVTIRRSTGGKGLHLYVFLEPLHTSNHNEHAAVARAVLSQLSGFAGFDFSSKVDICGGNMWVWHRKMAGTQGLEILKQGTTLAKVPANWRDYTKVVSGRRAKNLPTFIEAQQSGNPDIENFFEELTGQRLRVQPDVDHKRVMDWLTENYPSAVWWDAEHHMLVTHTALLKECHEALNLRGSFETNAVGADKGFDHNCFDGNTEVMTEDGPKKFQEISGQKIRLYVRTLSGMKWIESEIKCFGKQLTYPMYFGDGTKVRATYNHRWYAKSNSKNSTEQELLTWELKEGKSQLPIVSLDLPEYDPQGYAHGFVFGDGWFVNCRGKTSTSVSLFKNDNDLCKLLCQYGNLGTLKYPGHGYVNTINQLPNDWKYLPTNCTKEYALGFILGLISADGFVNNHLQIFQSDYEVLVEVQRLAMYCGLRPFNIRRLYSEGYDNAKASYALSISTYNLRRDHFIRRDQRDLFTQRKKHSCVTVSKIDWDTPFEEAVYCAVVPLWGNFTLANLVITGNCFAFPLARGAWAVRRYSVGVSEHPFWEQDGSGFTRCFYNREADLPTASRIYDGIEDPSGGFWFPTADDAQKAARLIGVDLCLPNWALGKKARLKLHKSGKLLVEIDKSNEDPKLPNWLAENKKFKRMFNMKQIGPAEPESLKLDESLRHLVSESDGDRGWVIRSHKNWISEPFTHVKTYLQGLGHSTQVVSSILGSNITEAWTLVNQPFKDEYPRDRQWNRDSARLRYRPSIEKDRLNYPTWSKILNHIGKGLDDAVKANAWCKANGIATGADWLKCWMASLFQEPLEPLPYLFMYGPQDSGKSIFHEALALLMTRGVVRADYALTSKSNFNGELEYGVLCVIEETDLRKNADAYNKIKDWVTSRQLPLHRKSMQPIMIPNTTHWIQCANSHLNCPVFPGDTRITMMLVDSLDPKEMIPKKLIIPMLEAEASDFMSEILSLELPPSNDRLNVPCIVTEDKTMAEHANMSSLETFCLEKCFHAPGTKTKFSEFYDKFTEWLDPNQIGQWTKIRVGRELPPKFVKAVFGPNEQWIGNLSFTQIAEADFGPRWVSQGGRLVQITRDS